MNKYYTGFKKLRTIMIIESKPVIKQKSKTETILKAFEEYQHESTLIRTVDMLRKWINPVYRGKR